MRGRARARQTVDRAERYGTPSLYTREMQADKIYTYGMHAHGMHAREIHTRKYMSFRQVYLRLVLIVHDKPLDRRGVGWHTVMCYGGPKWFRLNVVGAHHQRKGRRIAESVNGMVERNQRLRKRYQRPGLGTDRLYQSSFIHPDRDQVCDKVCGAETAQVIQCNERTADEDNLVVHYGLIASADRLTNRLRDTLARRGGVVL